MEELLFLSLFLILTLSSIWDIFKQKKIPNAFVLVGLILGLIYSGISGGWKGFFISLSAMIIVFIVGYFVLWGLMAAGDVKLFMMIATFLGTVATFKILILTLFVTAICSIILKPIRFVNSLKMVTNFVFYSIPIRVYEKSKSIAFAPFITISCVCFCFLFL